MAIRKFTLVEWASLGELVASVAVVISLVFVGYTIERNTREVRATHADNIFTAARDIEIAIASDPEWSRVIVEGRGGGALTSVEWHRYDAYVIHILDVWDQMLSRHEDGLLESAFFEDWDGFFEEFAMRHVTADTWRRIEWQWPAGPLSIRVKRIRFRDG